MIDARSIEITIVEGLKKYLSVNRPCEVVRANQTGPIPPYPYVAYTITTPLQSRSGTFSVASDGTRYRTFSQTWSFTFNSDDAEESINLALRAFDWFSVAGVVYLNDNGVVIGNLSNITNRDNIITIEYEHRNGFDVTFNLLHTVTMTEDELGGYIDTANIKQKEE